MLLYQELIIQNNEEELRITANVVCTKSLCTVPSEFIFDNLLRL